MSDIPDEVLMAYADNELSAPERAELEARLARDADLHARLEPFLATGPSLRAIFDDHLREPVPKRLIRAVASAGPRGARPRSVHFGGRWLQSIAEILFPAAPQLATVFGALALLFAGCFAGWVAGRAPSSTPPLAIVAYDNGELVAAGPLKASLETAASQPVSAAQEAGVRPTLTFASRDGSFCREYRIGRNGIAYAGVACRKAEGIWRIAAHVETQARPSGVNYETASGSGPDALNMVIDGLIQGDVLTAEDEAVLIAQDWQRNAR